VSPHAAVVYTAVWLAACAIAAAIAFRHRARLEIFDRRYWRFLLRPWKLCTFAVAAAGMMLVAPYTGDWSWTYVTGGYMSALAFATAPWSLGVLYRFVRGWTVPAAAFVAACVWLFSASWSYDLYIWLRDGAYPDTWLPNIPASSCLYAAAGLFWSLETRGGRMVFAFAGRDWFDPSADRRFRAVAVPACLLMAFPAASVLYFLV
jgi:hypothetical protein